MQEVFVDKNYLFCLLFYVIFYVEIVILSVKSVFNGALQNAKR